MFLSKREGWIEVICGSMFSGKSEELIRRVKRTKFAKLKSITFKPSIDSRYSEVDVVSHNGDLMRAMAVEKAEDIYPYVTDDIDVIAIDEVQFFDDKIVEVVQELANEGFRVIVAGLDQDFTGRPFASVPYLMAIAEHVTKLQAVCAVCTEPASMTQRLIDGEPASINDPIILIGATESYEPRCRHCHRIKN